MCRTGDGKRGKSPLRGITKMKYELLAMMV